MTQELLAAIKRIYSELQERKESADKSIEMFPDRRGYKEKYRADGRSRGLEEAMTLIEKEILRHWENIPEDDYTEDSYS